MTHQGAAAFFQLQSCFLVQQPLCQKDAWKDETQYNDLKIKLMLRAMGVGQTGWNRVSVLDVGMIYPLFIGLSGRWG
jgi:hypothetical protein